MVDRPPAIQPHGFLIGLSDDWLIQRASLNVADFLGRDARDLIGMAASDVLSVDAIHALRNRLALLRGPDAVERLFRCRLTGDDRHFDVAVHVSGNDTIIEAEPSLGKSYGDVTGTVRGMMGRLDEAATLPAMLDAGIHQLRAMTGFDRVAIVRLDHDGLGEVVAECTRGGIKSHLSEVCGPFNAAIMERFRRAPLQTIADTRATPVPVIPSTGPKGEPLDLSVAMLRAARPERTEQLLAEGIHAAMTISLLVGDTLWGLIECHHHFARGPGFERRSMADLFAQMFAMRIRIHELELAAGRGAA